jgi:O-antigen/teichoic acid export membrane protein
MTTNAEVTEAARGARGIGSQRHNSHGGGSLVRTAAVFASGNYFAMALSVVGGLLTSRLIEPAVLGLYNGIGLVQGYAPLLHLGVDNGLRRELPYELGKGSGEEAHLLCSAARAWSLAVNALVAAVLLGVAAWTAAHGRWNEALAWLTTTAGAGWVLYGQGYMQSLYRTSGDFLHLTRVTVVQAGVGFLLVAAVWRFGFAGLCLRGIVLALVGLVLTRRWLPIRVPPRVDKARLLRLFRIGVPIYAIGQLGVMWGLLNSTLVLALMGKEGLGLFAVAHLVAGAANLAPQALSQVLYPRMCETFGRTGRIKETLALAPGPVIVTLAVTALAVTAAWWLLPHFVNWALPKYAGGVAAAQWTAVGVLVQAFAPVNNIFTVIGKQARYGAAMLVGIGVNAAALVLLTRRGVYLEAFPQAVLMGRAATMAMSLLMAWALIRTEDRTERLP